MRRELDLAFRRTRYRVFGPRGELVLHVGWPDAALAGLMHDSGIACAALLTAFNPGGRRQSPLRNRQSQQRLHNELARQGLATFAGRNEHPRGLWPAEPTVLVPGLSSIRAHEIAARYGQAAFLWIDASGTPQLIATQARRRQSAASSSSVRSW